MESIHRKVDEIREEIIQSTRELIRIKSVREEAADEMPFGPGVAGALAYALGLSEKLGFCPTNLDNMIGWADVGDSDAHVAVLTHLDVVPEGDGDGWTYPPYGAEIHDNKIYGRGANDDKGALIASLYAVKVLKDLGLPLKTRVRIIFGTAEESGGDGILYYIDREKPPIWGFTPDGAFPIVNAEKGNIIFDLVREFDDEAKGGIRIRSIAGGETVNMVPDYCEAELISEKKETITSAVEAFRESTGYQVSAEVDAEKILVKSVGESGHSGRPDRGKNAVMQLILFLHQLPTVPGGITEMIEFLATRIGMQTDGEDLGIGLSDDISGKLALNVGTMNLDAKRMEIGVNIRFPVKYKADDVIRPLKETVSGRGVVVEGLRFREPLYYPEEHPLIQILKKVYTAQTGEEATLIAMSGGTYAKAMPNIVAFGPGFPNTTYYAHKPDECIDIDELIKLTKIYAHAIYALAN
ncbi:MAG: dipeptidase PepV [Deltaproteobacteria bacterium]|nr:dipeptidase PepV [Deltaproteobacteria bacterium]